jgi:hypothetical protein
VTCDGCGGATCSGFPVDDRLLCAACLVREEKQDETRQRRERKRERGRRAPWIDRAISETPNGRQMRSLLLSVGDPEERRRPG